MTGWGLAAAGLIGAVAAVGLGWALRASLARLRSLRRQVLLITIASLLAGAVVAFALAQQMVLEPDEAWRVVAVLGVTAGVASILVVIASVPLGRDVARLERVARAIEAGDREARTGVRRSDELGHVAAALDDAIARLRQLEHARAEDDARRNEMFAAIGHDLRTPLSALRAALEAMEDGLTPDPARYLRAMQHDVAALSALVDDLFLLSRIESGGLDPMRTRVDLAEIADEAAEALAPVAEAAGVRVELRGAAPLVARGDAVALGRVIRNLVDNAIRHSPPGSVVAISVEDHPGPLVRVIDAGDGFDPEFEGHAFDRFSRADASRSRATGGAGLGLAIAHGLVSAHGGEIWIDPPADGACGGSVAFSLPR